MSGSDRGENGRQDLWRGLPQPIHSPFTVEGSIEQAGKIGSGWHSARRGWRAVMFRAGVAILGMVVLGIGVGVLLHFL